MALDAHTVAQFDLEARDADACRISGSWHGFHRSEP
jgi:hypothetical protein